MDEHEINEQRIRELAYKLWEEHGKPDGSANRFWEHAEALLREQEQSNVVPLRVMGRRAASSPARPKVGRGR